MAKVFLSFRGEDVRKVWTLRGLSEFKNVSFEMDDESLRQEINSKDEYYIRSIIKPKVERCDVCVCLIGENTYRSRKWVPWEIGIAVEKSKPILAMRFWDAKDAITPTVLVNNDIRPFDWDVDKLHERINRY